MGSKPVYALAGLFVVGSLVSGCRSGASGGGYGGGSPQMMGQAPSSYTTQTTVAGRTPTATTRPTGETVYGGQPMPNATTYPSVTSTTTTMNGAAVANQASQLGGPNAFGSASPTVSQMPNTATYQMQPQNVQMQAPNVQSQQDDGMTRTPQTYGAGQTPRSFGTMPQQYQTQSLTPGTDQQMPR